MLCPPAPREQDSIQEETQEDIGADWVAPDENVPVQAHGAAKLGRKFTILRQGVSTLTTRGSKSDDPNQPLPFDHVFSSLDSRFDFAQDEKGMKRSDTLKSAESDIERKHEPDHAIYHATATKLVTSHHHLRPWEDIPPYQRARGYDDQPAYTDDYDDYLWLPRDPLSTLDLDDTVEMRLTLTTSEGGDGRIGDWPPLTDEDIDEVEAVEYVEYEEPTWHEWEMDVGGPPSPTRFGRPLTEEDMTHLALSPHIGSEVGGPGSGRGVVRRGTRRVSNVLGSLVHRNRSVSSQGSLSDSHEISMQDLVQRRSDFPESDAEEREPLTPTLSPPPGHGRPSMQILPRDSQTSIPRIHTPNVAALRAIFVPPGSSPPAQRRSSSQRPPMTSAMSHGSTSSAADSFFLSPVRTATPTVLEPASTEEIPEELDLGQPGGPSPQSTESSTPLQPGLSHSSSILRPSQSVAQLGRSRARRIPPRLRSQGSGTGSAIGLDLRTAPQSQQALSPTSGAPTRSRTILNRNRSVSAAQHQWLREVMEEEDQAFKDSRKEEREEQKKEKEEVLKEQAKVIGEAARTKSVKLKRSQSRFGTLLRRTTSTGSNARSFASSAGMPDVVEMTERPERARSSTAFSGISGSSRHSGHSGRSGQSGSAVDAQSDRPKPRGPRTRSGGLVSVSESDPAAEERAFARAPVTALV